MRGRCLGCRLRLTDMSVHGKLLQRIVSGNSDANISFDDLLKAMRHLGFECRIKGSHYIFHRADIPEILNFQPKGHEAKAYQVKQLREIITKYRLFHDDNT